MKGYDNMVEKKDTGKEEIEKSKEEQLHTTEENPLSKSPAPDADSNQTACGHPNLKDGVC
jgi:hypothetical protein